MQELLVHVHHVSFCVKWNATIINADLRTALIGSVNLKQDKDNKIIHSELLAINQEAM